MNTEPVSPSLKRGWGPLGGRSGRARSAAAGCNWPGAPSAPPPDPRAPRTPRPSPARPSEWRCRGDVCTKARRARGLRAVAWTLRGRAAERRSGLSAEDEAWASSSGQVRAAREEAAGGNLGRRRPALRGQGRWGRQGIRRHPSPNSLIQARVARSTPEKVPQHQPFLPKCSPYLAPQGRRHGSFKPLLGTSSWMSCGYSWD